MILNGKEISRERALRLLGEAKSIELVFDRDPNMMVRIISETDEGDGHKTINIMPVVDVGTKIGECRLRSLRNQLNNIGKSSLPKAARTPRIMKAGTLVLWPFKVYFDKEY